MAQNWLMVVQTRSPIRRHHNQRKILIGLGLNGIRRGRVLPDTPEIRGMIQKVDHLVQVLEGNLLGDATPALTHDLETLRRFNRRVTRTEQSAFWKRYEDQIPNAVSRFDNVEFERTGPVTFALQGTVNSFLEDFDQDQIAAFVLDYRQYTQKNDAISISSLARIYHREWMHLGAKKSFEEIRARYNQSLDASSGIMFDTYTMSVRELVDIVVYGGLAHSNEKKAATFESWEKSGIMGFVWASFFAAMRDLMKALKLLRTLNEQFLSFAPPAA